LEHLADSAQGHLFADRLGEDGGDTAGEAVIEAR
jgi:hypothetical protein